MLSRTLHIPRSRAANKNLNHACSHWSIDTHSFAWAWGESGLSLEDVVILTRLSLRGVTLLDLNNLSLADQHDVAELRRLSKQAQSGPRFTAQGVRKDTAANSTKTSFASWIRFFFKDLQPARTVAPEVPRDFVAGPHYGERLYMAGFFAFFLSYFVLPSYPVDSPSSAIFPLALLLARGECVALAPLFLGSLHCQLDLVHTDLARSLRSSDVSWHEVCDVAENFVPRPYGSATPRVVGIGQCLLPARSSLSVASGNNPIARGVINSALIALPGWLPFLNNEAHGVSVYCPDRFVRQLSLDQGVPGHAPLVSSFVDSQLCFTRPHTSDILAGLGDFPIPSRDDVGSYTPEFRLFWRRNLDSFLLFVRGEAEILEVSEIRTRDTSLRAIAEARGASWRGPHSMWAVTDATPLNVAPPPGFPPVPPIDVRHVPAQGTRGRVHPPAPAEPSQPSSSRMPVAGEGRRRKRLRTRELDTSTFVVFDPTAAATAVAVERAVTEGLEEDASDTLVKRRRFDAAAESEEEEDMDAGGDDDNDDDDNDDDDNLPLNVHLETLRAQSSMPAGGPVAQSITVLEHSAVIGGMLPDELSVVDLRGDPNTVSTESSSSSEDSENIIIYSTDQDPSPSNAASSEARESPSPMDTRESVELPHATAGGLAADQPGAGSTSTPSGSQQQSTSARIRSTESFLGRVAGGSPGVSNASFLQGPGSDAGRDVATDATILHSPACSTSQTHSPHPSARHTATPPGQVPLAVEDRQLEGSQALRDFGLDLNAEMGKHQREEAESRE
ncbi:hypothetical protein C3L33_22217, partial [Rhododendron williamsianum]